MNLRDRTRALLQGLMPSPPPQVQSYHVVCSAGHPLRGQRTISYQALRCPTCGEGIFVLPRSPLPAPPVPATSARRTKVAHSDEVEAEPEPIALTDPVPFREATGGTADDEAAELEMASELATGDPVEAAEAEIAQQAARGNRETASGKQRQGHGHGQARQRGLDPRDEPGEEAVALRVRLGLWAGRHRNPLLFLAVGLLILATVGIRHYRQRRQDLPRVAELGRVEGLEALDAGDFDKAYQLLSRARNAVDSLGDAVEGAAQIRQGAAEAEVFTSLVPDRLEAILDAAGRYDPKEWPARFNTLYQGRSIIVDGRVTAVLDDPAGGRVELDYQVLPDGEGNPLRVARIDTTGFRLFAVTRPKVGDQVTFGAKLASFTYDDRSHEWRIGLEPDSGVFLTHPKALESLGWPGVAELPSKEGDEP